MIFQYYIVSFRLLGECLAQACAQTTVQTRKEERTKDERRTDSSSHPHRGMADFDLGTQQNMERMTFHLRPNSTMNRGL
jgi:hypothetical protein